MQTISTHTYMISNYKVLPFYFTVIALSGWYSELSFLLNSIWTPCQSRVRFGIKCYKHKQICKKQHRTLSTRIVTTLLLTLKLDISQTIFTSTFEEVICHATNFWQLIMATERNKNTAHFNTISFKPVAITWTRVVICGMNFLF